MTLYRHHRSTMTSSSSSTEKKVALVTGCSTGGIGYAVCAHPLEQRLMHAEMGPLCCIAARKRATPGKCRQLWRQPIIDRLNASLYAAQLQSICYCTRYQQDWRSARYVVGGADHPRKKQLNNPRCVSCRTWSRNTATGRP